MVKDSMYIKGDGNGGIIINKGLLAVLTFILVMMTTFASVVAFSAGVKSDVSYNTEKLNQCAENLYGITSRVEDTEKSMSSVDTDIKNIKEDIKEIKGDIKILLKNYGGNLE